MKVFLSAICSVAVAGHLAAGARAQHEHHGGMHHRLGTGVKLETKDDAESQILTIRLGPIVLPEHTDHRSLAQPPDLFLLLPFDGWLIAYHPRLIDDAGNRVVEPVLHHVAFWNTARTDFLCPNKPEHIFGAGGELNDWPALPGYGYRVRKGDRIRVSAMFHNPTGTSLPKVYLEVKAEYRRSSREGSKLKNIYPAWFDVEKCASSGFDLEPGKNVKAGEFEIPYKGALLGVGGHLHDYGQRLTLENETRKELIARLDSSLDGHGHILSVPIVNFVEGGGHKLDRGEMLKVTATYDNTSGGKLPEGAMGIVVGYFLPEDDRVMGARAKRPGAQARGH